MLYTSCVYTSIHGIYRLGRHAQSNIAGSGIQHTYNAAERVTVYCLQVYLPGVYLLYTGSETVCIQDPYRRKCIQVSIPVYTVAVYVYIVPVYTL